MQNYDKYCIFCINTVKMEGSRFVITTEARIFHFDLTKDVGIDLKHEIYLIIKHNELLVEYTIKKEDRESLSKYKYENKHGKW